MNRRLSAASGALIALIVLGAGPAFAQIRDWPSEKPPSPLPARPSPFPPYDVRTLPNGLQVVVVRHAEQPAVSAQMLVKAGSAFNPAGQGGVASLVASLLDQGTTTRTAGEIADAVDSVGGELTVLSGTDASFAQMTVMNDSLEFGLDMLSDIIRTPAFAGEELERQRQQLRSGLRVSYEDPDYIAGVVFGRLVFGAHPYGLPKDGTPDSIARITRDDLVEFHRRYYAPGNCILAIVGDVMPDDAFTLAEKVFGGWERREVTLPRFPELPPPARRIVVIDKPDAVQTEIRAGHLGIARQNRDYLALDLGIRIFGGEGGNKLQQVLRTARGLTYGASANLDAYRLAGIVGAETDTITAASGEALRVLVEQFAQMQREGVEARELDAAKAFVSGSFPLGLETPGSISTKVLNALFYDLPLKDLETHRELISAITTDDVNRALRAYLYPDRLSIVLVGRGAALVTLLANVGFKEVVPIPLGALDLNSTDLKRSVSPVTGGTKTIGAMTPLATRTEWETVRPVLERGVNAAGGRPALGRVKTLSAVADTVLFTPDGPLKAVTKTIIQYPNRVRVDAKTPGGDIVQTYDAGRAWIWDKRGARDAPEAMRRQFGLSVKRDWMVLLLDGVDDRLTGRRVADETGSGGRLLHVVEVWDAELPPVRLAFDASSGRLERLSYQAPGPAGPETITETFGDFRVVEGVLMPFRAVTRRDEMPVLERTVTELKFNPVLQAGVFDKPS